MRSVKILTIIVAFFLASAAVWAGQPMPSLDGYIQENMTIAFCGVNAVAIEAFVLPGYEDSIAYDAVTLRVSDKPDAFFLILLLDWGPDRDYREDPDTMPLNAVAYIDGDRDGMVDVQLTLEELKTLTPCDIVDKYAN